MMKLKILFIAFFSLLILGNIFAQYASSIEEGIKKGPENIRYLTLKRAEKKIDIDFSKIHLFVNIKQLLIEDSLISYFPIEITTLKTLEMLYIGSQKQPISIPKEISILKNLKYLNLRNISNIPDELSELPQLENLFLDGNYTKIPRSIGRLRQLEDLYLKSKNGFILPDEVKNLQNLQSFGVHQPDALITPALLELKKIRRLEIRSKNMQVLPDSISKLSNLIELTIDAPIKAFPSGFAALKNLRILKLYNTQIKDIPYFFSNFTRLNKLHIYRGLLTKIPDVIFSNNLNNLQELVLNANQITKIDENWVNLRYLEILLLNENPIETLPESLPPLLRVIDISNSKVKSIPESWLTKKNGRLEVIFAFNLPMSMEEKENIKKKYRRLSIIMHKELGNPTEDK